MNRYETLLLFSPEPAAEIVHGIVDNYKSIIARDGGELVIVDDWGMRDLAYPVKKHMRGHYVRLEYKSNPSFVAELERNVRIADDVLKFVTVKLSSRDKAVEVPAATEA